MSTSSNITTRPAFRRFQRASDNAAVLVNMDLVQMVVRQNNTIARMHFGQAGNEHVDVMLADINTLREL